MIRKGWMSTLGNQSKLRAELADVIAMSEWPQQLRANLGAKPTSISVAKFRRISNARNSVDVSANNSTSWVA